MNSIAESIFKRESFIKRIASNVNIVNKDIGDIIKKSKKITVNDINLNVEVLKRILNNNTFFEYTIKFFSSVNPELVIGNINNSFKISVHILERYNNKAAIINGINKLILSGDIKLNSDSVKKLKSLNECVSFDRLKSDYNNHIYYTVIDGVSYSIPSKNFIMLLQMNLDEFYSLYNNYDKIFDIPKNHFLYVYFNFIEKNNIFNNYIIPSDYIKTYNRIKFKIDLESINQFINPMSSNYRYIKLDKDLKDAVFKDMPTNLTLLEKAIYIYIKLCKLLTYDDEYYALNQKGVSADKHKNPYYIECINPIFNNVVCFEFNMIYSKFLDELGINYNITYNGYDYEAYGLSHSILKFRFDKFLISVDSTTSILQSDLTYSKVNNPLIGIKCINKNGNTQEEFNDSLTKIYDLINLHEKNNGVYNYDDIEDSIKEYNLFTDNYKSINIEEKLYILINKVNDAKLEGIDSLAYILQLRRIIFSELERNNNIGVTFIRNNNPFKKGKVAMTSAIFTLNKYGFKEFPNENNYYYFNPNRELISISFDNLKEKFKDGTFEYISTDDPKIPGLSRNGGFKKW